MKRLLLALVAVGATVWAPAALADDNRVSGFVAVNLGATWSDFESDCGACTNYGNDGTTFIFSGQGRVNAWLEPGMSVQLDVEGEGTSSIDQHSNGNCSGCENDGRVQGVFGAHISWREPKSHLIGVFAAFAATNNLDYDGSMTHAILGVEAQHYAGPTTVYVQAGFAPLMSDSDEDEPKDLWFLRGVGRYFVNPNDRLQAEFGYANASPVSQPSVPGDYDIFTWGASWEHRYPNSPFSSSIEYVGFDNSVGTNWAREHIIQASFAIHFGDDTLQDQDREGAALDMPTFERALAWSWWLAR